MLVYLNDDFAVHCGIDFEHMSPPVLILTLIATMSGLLCTAGDFLQVRERWWYACFAHLALVTADITDTTVILICCYQHEAAAYCRRTYRQMA